jgi:hypothetical protein
VDTRTIFDAATRTFPWLLVWSNLGGLALGCIAVVLPRFKWWRNPETKWIGYFVILALLVTTPFYAGKWYLAHRTAVSVLANGRYDTVQGLIESIIPAADDGSAKGSFTVSGRTFLDGDQGDDEGSLCFRQNELSQGVLHAGMMVQVKFMKQCVLEIDEVTAESPPALQNNSVGNK